MFCLRLLGYEPAMLNVDQSPFHSTETGAQDKPTLDAQGGEVPLTEGTTDVKQRWTANISTCSEFTGANDDEMPFCEMCYTAASDGEVNERLQACIRSRGFPSWFTVTTSPKGSYREHDIITFLNRHLKPWTPGRRWYFLFADDFAAHKQIASSIFAGIEGISS